MVLITHKLSEVMAVADTITVMRSGKSVASLPRTETNIAGLSELMIGRRTFKDVTHEKRSDKSREPMLQLEDVTLRAKNGRLLLDGISFDVFAGEIVGIAGVEGNGQSELIEVLTGLQESDRGTITLNHESIAHQSPAMIRRKRVAHLPADRHRHGISLDDQVNENLILGSHNQLQFCQHGLLKQKAIRQFADDAIKKYEIRAGGVNLPIRTLSGGNQQKVVVARELESKPKLIIAAHPTRGLDIAAAQFVHQQLIDARNLSKGILLISADLEELLSLSDRIAVMYDGQIAGILQPSETDEAQLGALMLGAHEV